MIQYFPKFLIKCAYFPHWFKKKNSKCRQAHLEYEDRDFSAAEMLEVPWFESIPNRWQHSATSLFQSAQKTYLHI